MTTAASLHLYVDGSFDPQARRGGWGVVAIRDGCEIAALSGGVTAHDNGTVELLAILEALTWLVAREYTEPAAIWSDSVYAVNGCNRWRLIWKNSGWKKRSPNGKGRSRLIANAAIWQEIDQHLCQNPSVAVAWCKGHAENAWNERADALATIGRLSV